MTTRTLTIFVDTSTSVDCAVTNTLACDELLLMALSKLADNTTKSPANLTIFVDYPNGVALRCAALRCVALRVAHGHQLCGVVFVVVALFDANCVRACVRLHACVAGEGVRGLEFVGALPVRARQTQREEERRWCVCVRVCVCVYMSMGHVDDGLGVLWSSLNPVLLRRCAVRYRLSPRVAPTAKAPEPPGLHTLVVRRREEAVPIMREPAWRPVGRVVNTFCRYRFPSASRRRTRRADGACLQRVDRH